MKEMTIDDLARVMGKSFETLQDELGDLRSDFNHFKIEAKEEFANFRMEVKEEFANLRNDFDIKFEKRLSRLEDDMVLIKIKLGLK